MKLPGFKLVLACLVLVTCCRAAFTNSDLVTALAEVTEQVRRETFGDVVASANDHLRGRLTAYRPWPRDPGQLLTRLLNHLGNSGNKYVHLGEHGNTALFGVPWSVHWNTNPHENVFMFGIDKTSGKLTPLG